MGDPVAIEAVSPLGSRAVVFEDDGEAGYFYAVDVSGAEVRILDAMHIYTVADMPDRGRKSTITLLWDDGGSRAALLVNDSPHAVFDFDNRRGYCRDAYPEPPAGSNWARHGWDDELRSWFD